MAAWEFQVRRVVIENQSADTAGDQFRVDVEDGYEPLAVRREESVASGLPDGLAYEVVFARRV